MNVHAISHQPVQHALENIPGEAALLGALMSNNAKVDMIADRLAPEDFIEPIHGRIYDAILTATSNGKNANPVTLRPLFENDDAMKHLGGPAYLAQLTGSGAFHLLDVRQQAEQIMDLAARRRMVDALGITQVSAQDIERPIAEIVDEADAALVAAVEKREIWAQPSASDALGEVLERIQLIRDNEGRIGATTGINDIDDLICGFEPGQLVILAGRPGMGKTAVASSMALGLARNGNGVLFVSLEMKAAELGIRMASDLCFNGNRGVPVSRIIEGTVDNDEFRMIARARDHIKEWPLRIIDAGSVTMSRLMLGIRRHKRRMAAAGQELRVVMVDYLQLLQPDTRTRSAYEAVSEVSRMLKAIAKDCGVAIIALAQLSRGVENREDKRPQLSDLRDSGQIEQDADAVIFLYREEYYLKQAKPKRAELIDEWERQCSEAASRIDFLLRKRRNGSIGERTGYFFAHYQAVRGSDHAGVYR